MNAAHPPSLPAPSVDRSTGPVIDDTFAEAFPIVGLRLIVTAATDRWVETAAAVTTGYATSVIGCDAEAGLERRLSPVETPDGRPGAALLFFGFSRDALGKSLVSRIGQCLLTCPTTACYDGLPESPRDKQVSVGGQLRFFGDGFQSSKVIAGVRYWRVPVMDGEFLCADRFGTVKGVAGGNLLIGGRTAPDALHAAEQAAQAARTVPGVVLPFPGGVVRSGSKVGSRYASLRASTNEAYCPTLRGRVETQLTETTGAVYEIVIDGLSLESVRAAMSAALEVARVCPGVTQISAGNYGGKLGPHHIWLRELGQGGSR